MQTDNRTVVFDTSELRVWLLDHVCPYWSERVVDHRGGFFEGVDVEGRVAPAAVRHILVQARLTYVFSHAAVLGAAPAMRSAAEHGFAHLRQWSSSHRNGWARAQSIDGTVTDAARDSYDHAFIIFASAWHFRATGNQAAIAMADDAHAFMLAHLADTEHGGFFEEHPRVDRLPRRQNPHMHLLEATLAMHAATGAQKWLDASQRLVHLFASQMFDVPSGSLGEFFERDWSPAGGAEGDLREPGHQFEWVWLLNEYARASGEKDVLLLADRLFEFGSTHGRASDGPLAGIVCDGVDRDGRLTAPTSLFWPQTEYIKACVARNEQRLPGMYQAAAGHVERLRALYFRPDGANWCNQISSTGENLSPITPARVLYHLFLAIAEVLRMAESGRTCA